MRANRERISCNERESNRVSDDVAHRVMLAYVLYVKSLMREQHCGGSVSLLLLLYADLMSPYQESLYRIFGILLPLILQHCCSTMTTVSSGLEIKLFEIFSDFLDCSE